MCFLYPTDLSLPLNKLSRKEVEVCIKKNLVDVFLVGSASEIFGERFSVTQTLESRVHETRVTCRERLLEFTERLLKFTGIYRLLDIG